MEFDPSQFDLEQIRQYIEIALAEWGVLVEGIPTDELPRRVYVIGTALALLLWVFVARVLPSPLGRITWLFVFSVLCTPTVNMAGDAPQLVPASVAFVYGVLTKNMPIILTNATLMLMVFGMGLFVAFMWERIKALYIDILVEKQNERLANYEAEQRRLATVEAPELTEVVES